MMSCPLESLSSHSLGQWVSVGWFESWPCHFLAEGVWTTDLAFLCPGFPICKMRVIVPLFRGLICPKFCVLSTSWHLPASR